MEIHWNHPQELNEIDRDFASRRLQALQMGHSDLTDLWIDVAIGGRHHREGDENVTIRCRSHLASVVASGHEAEPGLALRSAISKLEREIWRLREKRASH
jgi:ribosome-associated translation inhibitor RaiA